MGGDIERLRERFGVGGRKLSQLDMMFELSQQRTRYNQLAREFEDVPIERPRLENLIRLLDRFPSMSYASEKYDLNEAIDLLNDCNPGRRHTYRDLAILLGYEISSSYPRSDGRPLYPTAMRTLRLLIRALRQPHPDDRKTFLEEFQQIVAETATSHGFPIASLQAQGFANFRTTKQSRTADGDDGDEGGDEVQAPTSRWDCTSCVTDASRRAMQGEIAGRGTGILPADRARCPGAYSGDTMANELIEQSAFGELTFADNPEPRCACVLVLDKSGSMAGTKIQQLNEGVRFFKQELLADPLAAKRVEVAVVSFGPITEDVDFCSPAEFYPPTLEPEGDTPIGAATRRAIEMVEARKAVYRSNGVSHYRPWIVLITDGSPTDSTAQAAAAVREGEQKKKFAFFAIGVDSADMGKLAELSFRPARMLRGTSFREFFMWLSGSMKSVSQSSPTAETVKLPSADGWAEL